VFKVKPDGYLAIERIQATDGRWTVSHTLMAVVHLEPLKIDLRGPFLELIT
jgi:hypothetical protein